MRNKETGVAGVAASIEKNLLDGNVKLRKQHVEALADLSATVPGIRSVNMSDWICVLPRDTAMRQSKERYILRFLSNSGIDPCNVMSVLVRDLFKRTVPNGSTAVLMLDQSKISERFECLMLSLRVGRRALPVMWCVEETKGAIGFDIQRKLLDEATTFIPAGIRIMLAADRFYGTSALVGYCRDRDWGYRIRLKGNLRFRHSGGDISPEEAYGQGMKSLEGAVFANSDVSTNIGILHEKGHPEPWFIAMDVKPTEYRTLDYGMRWGIECMFSDFKSRGFGITDTKLTTANRIERLLPLLSVASYWAVSTGLLPDPESERHTEKNAGGRLRPSLKGARADASKF